MRYRTFYIYSLLYAGISLIARIPLAKKVRPAIFFSGISRFPLRPVALTCAGRKDGGGAQIQSVMSVITFCKYFGYKYVHTPLQTVQHTADASEVAAWEHLFNLGAGEIKVSECAWPVISFAEYLRSPRQWFRKTVVAVSEAHAFVDFCPSAYLAVRDELRHKYAGPRAQTPDGHIDIAIHTRRGDVTASETPNRFTENRSIADTVQQIQSSCEKLGVAFRTTIYSQGSAHDFLEFEHLGCEFRLNQSPVDSLKALIAADVLVTAKSSFSYVAGLLSDGIVVYQPFWHVPLPDWLSTARLKEFGPRLSAYLDRRSVQTIG